MKSTGCETENEKEERSGKEKGYSELYVLAKRGVGRQRQRMGKRQINKKSTQAHTATETQERNIQYRMRKRKSVKGEEEKANNKERKRRKKEKKIEMMVRKRTRERDKNDIRRKNTHRITHASGIRNDVNVNTAFLL